MTQDNRNFRGVWIPADVWLSKELSLQEKVMLVEIDSLQDPVRGCYKGNASFAEFFGLSKSRVSAIISKLADEGWIHVKLIRDGKNIVERRIFITSKYNQVGNPPIQDSGTPYSGSSDTPIQDPVIPLPENSEERGSLSNTKERDAPSQSPGSTPPLFDEPSEPASQTCKLDSRANAVSLMQMWNDRADEYGTNWQRIDDPDDTSAIRYQRAKQRINQVRRRMEKKGVEPTLENILDWFDRFLHHMGDDPWYSGHPTDTNPKGYRLSFQQAFREDYFNDAIERLNQKQRG